MDFDRVWYTFSLDAEVDAYGTSRIAGAHNRLREENARLRAEVEDRQDMVDAQRGRLMELQSDNADLKAKLARVVEVLGEIRGRSLAAKTHEVGPLEAKGRLTRILELACAALAAARGE